MMPPVLAPALLLLLRVLDPHGLAVPGAAVEFRGAGGTLRLTTAQDGTLTAPLEPPLEIRVSATGFETAIRRIEAPPAGELVLRLRPATVRTSIEVRVRDELPGTGTAPEIDRSGARTVFDAVERLVPGAFVTRRGVMGYGIATNGTGIVTIRGIGESPNTGVRDSTTPTTATSASSTRETKPENKA